VQFFFKGSIERKPRAYRESDLKYKERKKKIEGKIKYDQAVFLYLEVQKNISVLYGKVKEFLAENFQNLKMAAIGRNM